jgi:AP-3 complex subunit delta-1
MRLLISVKYIALMAMVKIVPVRPELVAEHQAVILESLNDFDISIRMRTLELISSMVPPLHLPAPFPSAYFL